MIVRLFCPKCTFDASKNLGSGADIEVPVPVSQLSDDGIYQVKCKKGHVSHVVLDNVKFELLFEMGINALVDGYPREAVSSFASSLERFYEFFWRVTMNHFGVEFPSIEQAWKPLSKMAERQIGAYTTASLLLTRMQPKLLNPNNQIPFRNNVIHNGYVPKNEEAVDFGNSVMSLINEGLSNLRNLDSKALEVTYKQMSPHDDGVNKSNDNEKLTGCVNILTAIDVRHPPKKQDRRVGDINAQIDRVLYERQPMKMQLLTENEMQKRHPESLKYKGGK